MNIHKLGERQDEANAMMRAQVFEYILADACDDGQISAVDFNPLFPKVSDFDHVKMIFKQKHFSSGGRIANLK